MEEIKRNLINKRREELAALPELKLESEKLFELFIYENCLSCAIRGENLCLIYCAYDECINISKGSTPPSACFFLNLDEIKSILTNLKLDYKLSKENLTLRNSVEIRVCNIQERFKNELSEIII